LNYKPVSDALAAGADPQMLCATCPWDRFCITPPSMTRDEIDAEQEKARRKDEDARAEKQAKGEDPGMPMGMLMTAVMLGGKDTAATVCPVVAMRMRTSQGRKIVDSLRAQMTGWDDEAT
jgi:hypothetical protein